MQDSLERLLMWIRNLATYFRGPPWVPTWGATGTVSGLDESAKAQSGGTNFGLPAPVKPALQAGHR
jgi:hypothetical protein